MTHYHGIESQKFTELTDGERDWKINQFSVILHKSTSHGL